MRFIVNGYEVAISARRIDRGDEEMNDRALTSFLLELTILAGDAGDYDRDHEYFGTAAEARRFEEGFRAAHRRLLDAGRG